MIALFPTDLILPLGGLAGVGFVSMMYSRLYPDPGVVYSFPHASVPLLMVNVMEMLLLLIPLVAVVIMPALASKSRDVTWVVRAFVCLGMLYALGTIFARPLGLTTAAVIPDVRRSEGLCCKNKSHQIR